MNTEILLPVTDLKPALTGLNRIVAKKSTLPVLGHVRITRLDRTVTLQATDLDATATFTLTQPQEGDPIDVLMPLEQLNRAFKTSGKNDLALIVEGKGTKLRYFLADNPVLQPVNTLPTEDWPPQPTITVTPEPLQDGFYKAVREALACCSEDPTRHTICGACLDARDSKAHYVVGTNGRFLYSANTFSFPLKEAIIVPDSKFLNNGTLPEDQTCSLAVQPAPKGSDTRHISLQAGPWQYVTREIVGNYPNWKQVVPELDSKWSHIQLTEPAIEQLLRTIPNMPGKDGENHGVRLRMGDQVLYVEGRNKEDKEWTSIAVQDVTLTGKSKQITVNREYLLPALRYGLNDLAILDDLSPMVCQTKGKRLVIMPLRPEGPATQPSTPSTSEPPTTEAPKLAEEKEAIVNKDTSKPELAKPTEPQTTLIDQVERVKETLKNALRELTGLTDLAKQIERDKRAGDKEVETARAVLKKLQQVQL